MPIVDGSLDVAFTGTMSNDRESQKGKKAKEIFLFNWLVHVADWFFAVAISSRMRNDRESQKKSISTGKHESILRSWCVVIFCLCGDVCVLSKSLFFDCDGKRRVEHSKRRVDSVSFDLLRSWFVVILKDEFI